MGEVLHLFQCLRRGEPVTEFDEVFAVESKGFRECLHGRGGRQVLVTDIETLEEFGIPAGRGKENITTRGIAIETLRQGTHLRVGEAVLEVSQACTSCHLMDEIRDGLQEEMRGRRGMLCRVVKSGAIRRGDPIEIFEDQAPGRVQTQPHKTAQ